MPTIFRGRWVLPIAQPPLADGWVAVDGGRISAVGTGRAPAGDVVDIDGAILPALVNAHTHLELSWMRGQVPPAPSMPQWVQRLMALRRTVGHEPPAPIHDAIAEVYGSGTILVGDITNTLAPFEPLRASELSAVIFRELLGFGVTEPRPLIESTLEAMSRLPADGRFLRAIVPHAPYSVSPVLLRATAMATPDVPVSIHLGESREELQFLRDGTGPWRDLFEALGIWTEGWRAPGLGPVDYIEANGLLSARLLAVHAVQLSDAELRQLAAAGATVVTCPRSNRWVGAGDPPIERFYASGVRVAVGTDSLASVEDLNLWSELALIRELAPGVRAGAILASATQHGADALGFGAEFGTLGPGRRAALVGVTTPEGCTDVEEYLCSGITPDQVSWPWRAAPST
jgi:cytosine/adenosine deaminase-related metal-dependent hydrolase